MIKNKITLMIIALLVQYAGFSQTVAIEKINATPECSATEHSYRAIFSETQNELSCMQIVWEVENGIIVGSDSLQDVTIKWDSAGIGSLIVSVLSEPNLTCHFFDDKDIRHVTIDKAPSGGKLIVSANQHHLCEEQSVILTATISGDVMFGGWYKNDTLINAGSSIIEVHSQGVYRATASYNSLCEYEVLKDSIVVKTSLLNENPIVVGTRTVHAFLPVSGTISVIGSSTPIDWWEWKKGDNDWIIYSIVSDPTDYTLLYDNVIFTQKTLFRAHKKDQCSSSESYLPIVTIDVVDYVPDQNAITTTYYTTEKTKISSTTKYVDGLGRELQSHQWDKTSNEIYATQPIRNKYNQVVGRTLAAPINRSTPGFKVGFFTEGNQPYDYSDFEGLSMPKPADKNTPGTLGYFYGSQSPVQGVAETKYPYSVTEFYEDGKEIKRSSLPGDFHHLASGNIEVKKVLPMFEGELRYYNAIRNLIMGQTNVQGKIMKHVTIDAHGLEFVSYIDEKGNVLAKATSGGTPYKNAVTYVNKTKTEVHVPKGSSVSFDGFVVTDLVTGEEKTGQTVGQGFYSLEKEGGTIAYTPTYTDFTYNFYDNAARLVASIDPQGVQNVIDNTPPTAKEKLTFTSFYTYDLQNRLLSKTESDGGTTHYKHRRDGKIRFSKNAIQQGSFSYTNYDSYGRLIEIGEIKIPENPTVFQTISEEDINSTGDNYINTLKAKYKAIITAYVKTYYDKNMLSQIPTEVASTISQQEFVQGKVSSTDSETVQSWYGYNEQNKVKWFLQYYKTIGKYFLITYEYDFAGNIIKKAFQPHTYPPARGASNEAFWHRYTYNEKNNPLTIETSIDDTEYYLHATYEYYPHGPIKRVVLAKDLQGIDYLYTAQGWLKAINHPVRDLDPGNDGKNDITADAFGMTLEYFEGDYSSKSTSIGSLNLDKEKYPEQYNGNIRAMTFGLAQGYISDYKEATEHSNPKTLYFADPLQQHTLPKAEQSIYLSPGFESNKKTGHFKITKEQLYNKTEIKLDGGEVYSYTYQKNKIGRGEYSSDGGKSTTNAYNMSIIGYDVNGNIEGIDRWGENSEIKLHNYRYHYYPQSNRLQSVEGYINNIEYNAIGQVSAINYRNGTLREIEYNTTGKIIRIKDNKKVIMEIVYNDRDQRVMKRTSDVDEWYVRDQSGEVLAIYNAVAGSATVAQIELPIYGKNKIGVAFKNPDHYKYIYELTDHQGNIRALVTKLALQATASMEIDNGADKYEEQFFDNLQTRHQDWNNVKYGNYSALTFPNRPVGPTTTLRINAGDKIALDVYAKFNIQDKLDPKILTSGIANILTGGFNNAIIGLEGQSLMRSVTDMFTGTLAMITPDKHAPKAYLQYVLLDENFNYIESKTYPMSDDGDSWQHLELNTSATHNGYLYAYVVNESNVNVYFDHFTVQVMGNRTIRTADYYPMGALAKAWQNTDPLQQESYRYDYRGQYNEKDKETGYNDFEAGMYDTTIGRLIQTTPYKE